MYHPITLLKKIKQYHLLVKFNAAQKGQTLIIVTMVMILALGIGITVSERFVNTLRNIVSTDDDSKAQAIAEALVEKILIIPHTTLDGYITFNNCDAACVLNQADYTGQSVGATAVLSYTGNSTQPYAVSLTQDDTKEVVLTGYTTNSNIEVCWDGAASVYTNYIYNNSGIKAKGYAFNSTSYTGTNNDFSTAYSAYGYQNCFAVVATNTPISLRIKSIYENTEAVVVPAPGRTIPAQGIKIVSTGTAGKSKKTISVVKSNPLMPALFDYVLYQKSTTSALSN